MRCSRPYGTLPRFPPFTQLERWAELGRLWGLVRHTSRDACRFQRGRRSPYGTSVTSLAHPALKRWANLDRPYGARLVAMREEAEPGADGPGGQHDFHDLGKDEPVKSEADGAGQRMGEDVEP
jgi:hypothetical protein